jgi:LysM repeat protein
VSKKFEKEVIAMKLKRAIGLLVMLLAILAFGTVAQAAVAADCSQGYIVKKGDNLGKISKICGVSVNQLYAANKGTVKNKNKIYPNQKLSMPDVNAEFRYRHPGREKYTGNLNKALELLGYPKIVASLFKKDIENERYDLTSINNGDRFAMVFGKDKVRKNTVADFVGRNSIWAKKYSVEYDGIKYVLMLSLECGNWARYPEIPLSPEIVQKPEVPEVQLPPEPVKELERPKVPQKRVEIIEEPIAPPVETEEPKDVPEIEVPEYKTPEKKLAIEHEPIVGANYWDNDLAHGHGFYGEYMAWLRKEYPWGYANGWSPGVGVYGYYSEGDTETKPHYWWVERAWGPQVGLKYIGETKEGKPWQWQGKIRLVWEHMHGENAAGYEIHQDNTKVGFYTELLERYHKDWIFGATAEGWYAFRRNIESTWSGDRPSNRTQLAVNILAQYKISEDWQVRGVVGPFYQGWDELWGMRALAELRYKETIMAGPWRSWYPFGLSDTYKGISAGNLTTLGWFVRVELGAPIRSWDRKIRMDKIRKMDEKLYGTVTDEKLVVSEKNLAKSNTIRYNIIIPKESPVITFDN